MHQKAERIAEAIKKEVAKWPGVEVEFLDESPHPKAKFTFQGQQMKRAFPSTPRTDSVASYLGDMRRVMKTLGAQRETPPPSAEEDDEEYRKANGGREARDLKISPPEPAPAKDTLFERMTKAAQEGKIPQPEPDGFLEDFGREPGSFRIVADPEVERSGWGLYHNITVEQYHLDPCPDISLSNSLMKPLLDLTPANMWNAHPRNPAAIESIKETIAKTRGDVVHQLVLGKGKGFAVGDFKSWQSNDSKAFKAEAEEAGLVPIKRADFEEAEIIAARVLEVIKRTLDGAKYETEVVFMYQEQTQFGPVWVRGMMDIWCEERMTILDPKITSRLYDGMIERHAPDMGWDRQAVLYPRALGKINPEWAGRVTFADLMVDPDPPYVHRFWRPDRAWDHTTHKQIDIACDRFARCLKLGEWPAFGDDLHFGQIPKYIEQRRTDMELKG